MAVLSDIFSFLGAANDDATLHRIADETDISRMRAVSRNPGFFRAGAIDMGGDEITPELRRELEGMVAEPMERLGYRRHREHGGKPSVTTMSGLDSKDFQSL
jgi:hypothetical protein